jgi:hypothetical protein
VPAARAGCSCRLRVLDSYAFPARVRLSVRDDALSATTLAPRWRSR